MKVRPTVIGKTLAECEPGEVFRFDSYNSAPLATVIGQAEASSGKLVVFFESFDAQQKAPYWEYISEPADFGVASFGTNCIIVPATMSQDWRGGSWREQTTSGVLTISKAGVFLTAVPAIRRRGSMLYWNIENGMQANGIVVAQAERAPIAAVHWKICAPREPAISCTDGHEIIFEHNLSDDKKA